MWVELGRVIPILDPWEPCCPLLRVIMGKAPEIVFKAFVDYLRLPICLR
jgi:hypothetical protein